MQLSHQCRREILDKLLGHPVCSPRGFSLLLRPSLAVARRPLPVVAVLPALVARVDRDPEDGGADLVLHEELVVLRNVDVVLGQPLDAHRSHE